MSTVMSRMRVPCGRFVAFSSSKEMQLDPFGDVTICHAPHASASRTALAEQAKYSWQTKPTSSTRHLTRQFDKAWPLAATDDQSPCVMYVVIPTIPRISDVV